jgi:hypothetical protein
MVDYHQPVLLVVFLMQKRMNFSSRFFIAEVLLDGEEMPQLF